MRTFYTCLLALTITGCGLTLEDFKDIMGNGAVEEGSDVSPGNEEIAPSPTPLPTVQPTPTPEEPEPEKKPRGCRDSGAVVVGHNHSCRVGSISRGSEVLKFTGSRGGLEALKSHTTGELKLGLPWDYSCELAKDVKVCGPKGCMSAQNDRTAWVNYDSTPQGDMCTQWVRWGQGNDPKKVFRQIGAKKPKEAYFLVEGHRINLCTKQWNREERCS